MIIIKDANSFEVVDMSAKIWDKMLLLQKSVDNGKITTLAEKMKAKRSIAHLRRCYQELSAAK